MRRVKGLDEIHEIIEKIYDEEVDLSREQRLRNIREESDSFLLERRLGLKRVNLREIERTGGTSPKTGIGGHRSNPTGA